MTPPPNDTGIDDRHELFFFESSAHDQTIASWLAQYTYTNNLNAAADNVRSPPSELISTFFLGYVRESLGMTIPIIWMANLACNFSSEFTDSDFFKNQEKTSTIRMYRQFTMEEQKRFDALQLTYLTQKIEHSIDLEYCGTKQFNLSPRMIISSKAERSKMIEVLIRYLDVKAKGEKREKKEFSNDEDKNFVKRGMGKKKTKKMNRRRYLRRQQQAKEQELSLMILSFDNDSRNDLSVNEQNDNEDENDNNEFQVSNEEWCCDYCGVAMFPTYEDACQHENVCFFNLKLKEKEDTATVDDNEAKNMYSIKEEIAEESTSAPIATQSTLKDEAPVAQQEKVLCESLTNVMRSAMIDYDDRVNDTALPLPNQDAEELSIPVDKIYKLSSSPIQPILLYNVHAAKTADEVGLLQRVTNLTRENELLIDHTNLLIKQNNALTEKLVETKRQSIEAVQQVHLKAYIAETARTAADERASQLVGMLTDYVTYKVTDEVMRQDMLGALARVTVPSSSSISHTQMRHVQHADAQALYTDSTTSNDILTPSSPGSILNRLRCGDHAS